MEIRRLKDDVYLKILTNHCHVSPKPLGIEEAYVPPPIHLVEHSL